MAKIRPIATLGILGLIGLCACQSMGALSSGPMGATAEKTADSSNAGDSGISGDSSKPNPADATPAVATPSAATTPVSTITPPPAGPTAGDAAPSDRMAVFAGTEARVPTTAIADARPVSGGFIAGVDSEGVESVGSEGWRMLIGPNFSKPVSPELEPVTLPLSAGELNWKFLVQTITRQEDDWYNTFPGHIFLIYSPDNSAMGEVPKFVRRDSKPVSSIDGCNHNEGCNVAFSNIPTGPGTIRVYYFESGRTSTALTECVTNLGDASQWNDFASADAYHCFLSDFGTHLLGSFKTIALMRIQPNIELAPTLPSIR